MGIPDALDRGRANSLSFGHDTTTPTSGSLCLGLGTSVDDLLDPGGCDRGFTARPAPT